MPGRIRKDQKSNIRMRRPRQEDVVEPEGDGGQRRAGRDHGTRKRDGILAEKIDGLRPLLGKRSRKFIGKRYSLFFLFRPASTHFERGREPFAAPDRSPDIYGTNWRDYFFSVRM
jgi:hypothetical protein